MSIHRLFMEKALQLSAKARFLSPPNPWVGCVIVKNGEIVGEGFTQPPGGNHAEIEALKRAGERARGATMYVTLEPCAHQGKTPPCTLALIQSGISAVYISTQDPDSKVGGRGILQLQDAGIAVHLGEMRSEVESLLTPYLHQRRTKRPYCIVKAAITVDGKMAAADGTSQWITCETARADVHRMRAESQAIIIGANTAREDNPSLTVRHFSADGVENPLRVVVDTHGRVPQGGALFNHEAPTWHVTSKECPGEEGIDLLTLLKRLAEKDVLQVLVEGGPKLITSFFTQKLIDKLCIYVGPRLLGKTAFPLLDSCISTLKDAPELSLLRCERLGSTVRLEYCQK